MTDKLYALNIKVSQNKNWDQVTCTVPIQCIVMSSLDLVYNSKLELLKKLQSRVQTYCDQMCGLKRKL